MTGCRPATEPSVFAAAITNGSDDDGDAAVVALTVANRVYCTGTLIAPRVVLTAAHCMSPPNARVFFGPAPELGGAFVDIREVQRPASFNPSFDANDIAVALLSWPGPASAQPWTPSSTPLDDQVVGKALRVIGFGTSDSSSTSSLRRKRSGIATLSSLAAADFTLVPAPAQPCLGDSGGAEVMRLDGVERLIGVTSAGDPLCQHFARATRVDAFVSDFIAPYLQRAMPGGLNVGSRCLSASDCLPGLCIAAADRADFTYCSAACDADGPCPPGMSCERDSCRYPLPTRARLDEPCSSDSDCEEGVCARPAGAISPSCVQLCQAASRCGPGHICMPDVEHAQTFACFSGESGGCARATHAPLAALLPLGALLLWIRLYRSGFFCLQNSHGLIDSSERSREGWRATHRPRRA